MLKRVCTNFMCSIYVFGASAGSCPECGSEGIPMTEAQDREFLKLYNSI